MSGVQQQRCVLAILLAIVAATATLCWRHGLPPGPASSSDRETGRNRAAELGIPADTEVKLSAWREVEDFEQRLAQFNTVFWDPADTISLRKLIRESDLVGSKDVLEIGTGTGLISLVCLAHGARKVVATDINPSAIANAAYNAEILELNAGFETRLVSKSDRKAFAVLGSDEKFDVILSNPPWEDQRPERNSEFALYDQDFVLLKSILDGLPEHLRPGGRALLAYGCKTAIRKLLELAEEAGYETIVHDERELDSLDEVFLPGMLIEVRVP